MDTVNSRFTFLKEIESIAAIDSFIFLCNYFKVEIILIFLGTKCISENSPVKGSVMYP